MKFQSPIVLDPAREKELRANAAKTTAAAKKAAANVTGWLAIKLVDLTSKLSQ